MPPQIDDDDIRRKALRWEIIKVRKEISKRLRSIGVIRPPAYSGLGLTHTHASLTTMLIASGGVCSKDDMYHGLYAQRGDDIPTRNSIETHITGLSRQFALVDGEIIRPRMNLYQISATFMEDLKSRQKTSSSPRRIASTPRPPLTKKLSYRALQEQLEERQFQLTEINKVCAHQIHLYEGVTLNFYQAGIIDYLLRAPPQTSRSATAIQYDIYASRFSHMDFSENKNLIHVLMHQIKKAFEKGRHPIDICNPKNEGYYLSEESRQAILKLRRTYGIDYTAAQNARRPAAKTRRRPGACQP